MKPNVIASPELSAAGLDRLEWVRANMPVLRTLERELSEARPFTELNVAISLHLEAKTAYLALVLAAGGARVAVCGSNPESTKDDVAAALASRGVTVYAKHGASAPEMEDFRRLALDVRPDVVIDDGGDLVELLHQDTHRDHRVIGACEETTTGVERARERARAGTLRFPVLLINDARCKHLFDNVFGTGESTWAAIMRASNLSVAGKTVAIVGYGWCGRGCAQKARGLGARVLVSEIDPVKALEAAMDGFEPVPLLEACSQADTILSVTGARHTLRGEHFLAMKPGALVANAGHFRDDVDTDALVTLAEDHKTIRDGVHGYRLPPRESDRAAGERWIYLLADGNIVNIACGDGHPAEIMDLSFAVQASGVSYLVEHGRDLEPGALPVPPEIDERVAALKLEAMGLAIDKPLAEPPVDG